MRLKKIKGALERIQASPYYMSNPQAQKGKWHTVFHNSHPIQVEIGMGKGNFIIGMAKKYPEKNFIGIEMYDSVMVKAVQKLEEEERNIPNLKLVLVDANEIENIFDKEIDQIYLNFSDPWPKAKHAKRRLTSPTFLQKYEAIFQGEHKITMKTDNTNLFQFSVEMLQENGYNLMEIVDDLASLEDTENVLTEYEEKFMKQDIPIHRFKAIK